MYGIICTRALPNVITCIMHDITCTRALPYVIICIMHDITYTRALPNVITCIMHDITCTRVLPNVRLWCMTGIWKNVIKTRGDTEKRGSAELGGSRENKQDSAKL